MRFFLLGKGTFKQSDCGEEGGDMKWISWLGTHYASIVSRWLFITAFAMIAVCGVSTSGAARDEAGAGIRIPVAPYQADNDLRLQLFYHAGYFYNMRTNDTGSNVRLPPDTFIHGLRLRARYDGFRRNFMELPPQRVGRRGRCGSDPTGQLVGKHLRRLALQT